VLPAHHEVDIHYKNFVRLDFLCFKYGRPVKKENCILVLHQDNASDHVLEFTKSELGLIGIEYLGRPPYSLDLAQMDRHVS